ncbi:mechanosensitive ion channel family protein [Aidingimonas lacisalsi]|uniref:mechanosensitive ion channel family protein n=1 Tax=Aidingimonas lacisalsi TaxID=2604086 RepID=UPI0011D23038|nr:mechanosensitive ion channel family protein [Aidingimonas lacisalsi]
MQDWMTPLETLVEARLGVPDWLVIPALLLLAAAVADLAAWLLIWRLGPLLERTRNRWDDTIVMALRRPLRVWIWGMAIVGLLRFTGLRLEWDWINDHYGHLAGLFSLLMFAWTGVRLVGLIEKRLIFPPAKHKARSLDPTTASAVSKVVGAIIMVVVFLLAFQLMGMSVSGLLAFGGVGGILVGFAARDVLANFFGGLAVHLDDPFKVGDWIRSPDRDIEGIVEDIGWRLTRIRTFDSRPLYVPNATFSTISVENPSRMFNRRIFQQLSLRYEDLPQVRDIVHDIRQMLDAHEYLDHQQTTLVNFQRFGDDDLELFVHAYTRTTDWAEHQDIQQDVLLRIADIIASHDAALAIPSREVHLHDMAQTQASGDTGSRGRPEGSIDEQRAASERPETPGQDHSPGSRPLRGDEPGADSPAND